MTQITQMTQMNFPRKYVDGLHEPLRMQFQKKRQLRTLKERNQPAFRACCSSVSSVPFVSSVLKTPPLKPLIGPMTLND